MEITTIILRFTLTFTLALIYGFERQFARKAIGFGTFVFVSSGACALAIVALRLTPSNPLPLLAAIITGIGFLGAGALFRTGEKVTGFTSAALIWIYAILGVVIGVGEYWIGGMIYGLIWVVTIFDRLLEVRGIGTYNRRLTVHTSRILPEKEISSFLFGIKKHKLLDIKTDKNLGTLSITYSAEGRHQHISDFAALLLQAEWCDSFDLE